MNNNPWFLYLALANTGRYYTGISQNISKRIYNHNKGNGSKFAINQGPFKLVYFSEPIHNYKKAIEIESKVKNWSQKKKEKLISHEWKLNIE